MNEIITINQQQITAKEYKGQRVITLKDVDTVHNRPEGTARRNFNSNKGHLIEGTDYYKISPNEFRTAIGEMDARQSNDVTLITESGYLMLVKSFTDDLAWDVQRALVNNYFRVKTAETNLSELSPELRLLISLELKQKEQQAAIENVSRRVDNIGEVIALDTNSWRTDAKKLITGIAQKWGGNEYIPDVNRKIYELVDKRGGVSLAIRLANKRNRMAGEGISRSKQNALTKVDVIAEDKKLIEIYIAIVKQMAVKYGVELKKEEPAC